MQQNNTRSLKSYISHHTTIKAYPVLSTSICPSFRFNILNRINITMKLFNFTILSALTGMAFGLYEKCHAPNGLDGMCLTTGSCASGGGQSHPQNLCPGPQNVQCCTKTPCDGHGEGACAFAADCRAAVSDVVYMMSSWSWTTNGV